MTGVQYAVMLAPASQNDSWKAALAWDSNDLVRGAGDQLQRHVLGERVRLPGSITGVILLKIFAQFRNICWYLGSFGLSMNG